MPHLLPPDLVRPSAPAPVPFRSLTPLDRVNFWLIIRGTWLFRGPLDPERLRAGLADLLVHYPTLAGRVVDGVRVDLGGQGVPVTVAERPDLSVDDVCARPELAGDLSNRMDKGAVKRGREAPLTARVTRLADGSALGVRCSHAFLDGNGFYTFVRNWSRACAGLPFSPPDLDPGRIPVPEPLSRAEAARRARAAGWQGPSLLGLLRAAPNLLPGRLLEREGPLRFSAAALAELRSTLALDAGCPDLTTHEALAAVLASVTPTWHGLPPGAPCTQAFVTDSRERVAGIPASYAANAAWVTAGAAFSAGDAPARIAARTHAVLGPRLARPSEVLGAEMRLGLEVMRHGLLLVPYDVTRMHVSRPTLTYVNSFVRLPIYDVDFGTPEHPLRPHRAIPHDLPDPFLIWPAPTREEGVEVWLTGVAARAWRRQGRSVVGLPGAQPGVGSGA